MYTEPIQCIAKNQAWVYLIIVNSSWILSFLTSCSDFIILFPCPDVEHGFKYWTTETHPVIGDRVEVYFKASQWKYSKLQVYNGTMFKNLSHSGWDARANVTYTKYVIR